MMTSTVSSDNFETTVFHWPKAARERGLLIWLFTSLVDSAGLQSAAPLIQLLEPT